MSVVAIRMKRSGSWLDPDCSGVLGWKAGKRLWARVLWGRDRGEKGVFITLTYRREEYPSAKELYHRQSERKHVAYFMRRLERRLGVSLKGKWLRKMEFQQGGWVHWHIVLLGVEFIDQALLTRVWGKGFVWITRLTKKEAFYTCKYVAKDGNRNVPLWIYGERPKSVKIIAVSHGFWCNEPEKAPRERGDVQLYEDGTEVGKRMDWSRCSWVPIGVKLRQRGVIIRTDRGVHSRVGDPGCFLMTMNRLCGDAKPRDGWLWYECVSHRVEAVLAAAGEASAAAERVLSEAAAERGPPRSGPLHLRGTSNRAVGRPSSLHWWINAEYEQDALDAWHAETDHDEHERWPSDAKVAA